MAFGYSIAAFGLAFMMTLLWFLAGGGILPGVAIYVLAGQLTLCSLLVRAAYLHHQGRMSAPVTHL